MWGIAREWGTVSTSSAFKGEGRHQSLKSEIRKKSFKAGSKKRGSRLRGARRALRKGWAEVLRNDNLDWGLYAKGFDVCQPSWTAKRHMGMPSSIGKGLCVRGSCRVSRMFVVQCYNSIVHALEVWWWNTTWTCVTE